MDAILISLAFTTLFGYWFMREKQTGNFEMPPVFCSKHALKSLTLTLYQATMKYSLLPTAVVFIAGVLSASAAALPGAPEANGLVPQTATLYINGTNQFIRIHGVNYGLNNNNTESLGVGIASSGNVLVAWEDDNDNTAVNGDLEAFGTDFEAAWTMFDSQGNSITPQTQIYSPSFDESITNNYLGFFRTNGSPYPALAILPAVAWGPKVHANLFGNGIGMGASETLLGIEDDPYANYFSWGGTPAVQLLDGAGQPQNLLAGVTVPYGKDPDGGSIRIGDWEYLANSNIVIVGESRQPRDLTNFYGGTIAGTHAIYSIVTRAGVQVRSNSPCMHCPGAITNGTALVSATNGPNQIWHGVGVVKGGFAVRFSDDTAGTCVRMFDNDGNPTTGNLVLATLTGCPQAGGGGRGGGAGFHGNGMDAYVHAASYSVGGTNGFWLTVLNTNATVRWSRDVADDLTLVSVGDGDAAITESGEVVVVFNAVPSAGLTNVVVGRRFDMTGNPVGGTFYVSEKEVPNMVTPPPASTNPRVAYRSDKVAIVWESKSYPGLPGTNVVAQRYFLLPPRLSVASSGADVTISWLPSLTGYTLEASSSVAAGSIWTPVSGVVNNSLTTNSPAGTVFYRMKKY